MASPYSFIATAFTGLGLPPRGLRAVAAILFIVSIPHFLQSDTTPLLPALLFLGGAFLELSASQMLVSSGHNLNNDYVSTVLLRVGGYGIFFAGLGMHLFLLTDLGTYLFAILLYTLLWFYLAFLLSRYPVNTEDVFFGLHRSVTIRDLKQRDNSRRGRLLFAVSRLFDPEIFPLFAAISIACGLSMALFWIGIAVLIATILFHIHLLHLLEHTSVSQVTRGAVSFLFYIGGASILLLLILRMPFADLVEAVKVVGTEDAWLILVPALWVLPYAITLQILLDYRVTFRQALYTQITGDAFNSITPLLGLGGEPYKAAYLSRYVPIEDAGRAIIQSRLIHALSGVVFTVIILIVTVSLTDLSAWPGLATGMIIIALLMSVVFLLLLWITMSAAPTSTTAFIMTKLKIPADFQHKPLGWKKMWLACVSKMAGRCAKFLELYLIFVVLDMSPQLADVVLVEAMIMISVSVFFFVPQGIGVNEAGIVTAFSIIGFASATAVAFGLIRRARMIIYTVAGLLIYLLASLFRFRRRVHQPRETDTPVF